MSKTSGMGSVIGKVILGCVLLAFTLISIVSVTWPSGPIAFFTTAEIGTVLFEKYGIVLVVLGLLLYASMIAGVFIAQEEDQ